MTGLCTNSGWFSGFLSGVLATLLGFGLTMLWDNFKQDRSDAQNKKILLRAILQEVKENINTCTQNAAAIRREQSSLDQGLSLVEPIFLFRNRMWELGSLHLPAQSEADVALLQTIANCSSLVNEINDMITSRENYRIHNQAMTTFHDRLRHYNNSLLTLHERLFSMLNVLSSDISSKK